MFKEEKKKIHPISNSDSTLKILFFFFLSQSINHIEFFFFFKKNLTLYKNLSII